MNAADACTISTPSVLDFSSVLDPSSLITELRYLNWFNFSNSWPYNTIGTVTGLSRSYLISWISQRLFPSQTSGMPHLTWRLPMFSFGAELGCHHSHPQIWGLSCEVRPPMDGVPWWVFSVYVTISKKMSYEDEVRAVSPAGVYWCEEQFSNRSFVGPTWDNMYV